MKKVTTEQYRQNREKLLGELENNNLTLGQFIRKARKVIGKTQLEYAKMVRIDPKVLSNLENDKANVTQKTINKLLKPWKVQLVIKQI